MNVVQTQFCDFCLIELKISDVPEVITTINLLKLNYVCEKCKNRYSVTWNFKTGFSTRFRELKKLK